MDRPDLTNGRWGGAWIGALARVLVFAALTAVLAIPLMALWLVLGLPVRGLAAYAATAPLALAALAAGAILLRTLDGRPAAALGIGVSRQTARHVAVGWAIGVAALAGAAAALALSGALRYTAAPGTMTAWLAALLMHGGVFAVAALMEEAIFRGYPFQVLVRAAGPVVAAVATSALFAAVHGRNPEVSAFGLVNIFLAGLMLAAAYLRTLSLWFATALHIGWNWATASLFDLPVSGITDFRTPLYEPILRGPEWWSGGTFGPEGGLVGTIGFGLALLLVLRLRAVRPDPGIAAAAPLVLDRERGVR
jgi:uncharacterized protein